MEENIKLNEEQFIQKNHIVLDCDEVLCWISPKWVYKISQEYDYFKKYLNIPENIDLRKYFDRILMRPCFNLDSWLFKHNQEFSKEEILEFKKRFLEVYNTDDFYDDLEPTPFAKGISSLSSQKYIKTISIVTKGLDKNQKSKERFIYKLFNHVKNKVDIYYLDLNEKKSDVIKNLGNNIGIIAEDELFNINDIIDNCDNIKGATFYVPKYGYNIPESDLITKATNKNIELKYFN